MKTYYEEYDMIDFARKRRFTQTIRNRIPRCNPVRRKKTPSVSRRL